MGIDMQLINRRHWSPRKYKYFLQMVDLMMTMMITDHWSLIRAHGLIEGDLYIGALFSIHDQVKLNDEDDEDVKTTI